MEILKSKDLPIEEILIKEISSNEWLYTTIFFIAMCVLDYKITNWLTNDRNEEHTMLGILALLALIITVALHQVCGCIVENSLTMSGWYIKGGLLALFIFMVIYKAESLQIKYKTKEIKK